MVQNVKKIKFLQIKTVMLSSLLQSKALSEEGTIQQFALQNNFCLKLVMYF